MPAGYSGTPLPKKLGIKPGMKVLVLAPPSSYLKEMSPSLKEAEVLSQLREKIDFIHIFSKSKSDLKNRFARLKEHLEVKGMIWVSWPKGTSKIETDLNGDLVRKIGLDAGLVDIKVCAVDEDWSGLKFVYRKKDR